MIGANQLGMVQVDPNWMMAMLGARNMYMVWQPPASVNPADGVVPTLNSQRSWV
jgi:hypothetical protein